MMQKDSRINKEILENAFADEGVVAEKKAAAEVQHKQEVAQVAANLVKNTKQAHEEMNFHFMEGEGEESNVMLVDHYDDSV